MEVKNETDRRDGGEEPVHPDQLSSAASPEPNIAQTPCLLRLPEGAFSENALPSEVGTPDPLKRVFEAYERRYSRLKRIQFDSSSRRMELRHRLDDLTQHLDRLPSSIEAYIDRCVIDPRRERKRPRARRQKLQSFTGEDFEAPEAKLYDLDTFEYKLWSFDNRQEQAESSYVNAFAQISTESCHSNSTLRPGIQRDLVEDQSARTPQPPISGKLQTSYDVVNMVRNMEKRNNGLQIEQQKQLERRGVMEDRGQMLYQSEDEFLRDWGQTPSVTFGDIQHRRISARMLCEAARVVIPASGMMDSGEQRSHDNPGRMKEQLPSLDGLEAELVHVARFGSWYEFEKGCLAHFGLKEDPPISPTGPARWPCLSDTRKKWPSNFSRLARSCFPLIAAALPLVTARVNEAMVQDALPTLTDPDGLPSSHNGQNAAREELSTVFQYVLAISPPLILFGGIVGSVWILTRGKRTFERQKFLFLMTFTASVSWWTLATMTRIGDQGSIVSISTWLALAAIYTSRNLRGLRNGTWHLFVTLLGGLAITSLSALALLAAEEASMEGFVHKSIIVGPSILTAWSWLAALGQQRLEEPTTSAVTPETALESFELQDSTNATPE